MGLQGIYPREDRGIEDFSNLSVLLEKKDWKSMAQLLVGPRVRTRIRSQGPPQQGEAKRTKLGSWLETNFFIYLL